MPCHSVRGSIRLYVSPRGKEAFAEGNFVRSSSSIPRTFPCPTLVHLLVFLRLYLTRPPFPVLLVTYSSESGVCPLRKKISSSIPTILPYPTVVRLPALFHSYPTAVPFFQPILITLSYPTLVILPALFRPCPFFRSFFSRGSEKEVSPIPLSPQPYTTTQLPLS